MAEIARKQPMLSYGDDPRESRFGKEALEFFIKAEVHTIGPAEVEQFNYDVRVDQKANILVLTTDESDVSGFLKLLIEKGARVEVYSAHDYPDTKNE